MMQVESCGERRCVVSHAALAAKGPCEDRCSGNSYIELGEVNNLQLHLMSHSLPILRFKSHENMGLFKRDVNKLERVALHQSKAARGLKHTACKERLRKPGLFSLAKQPQFPQPLLTRLLLQTLHQLRCPSLDTLQHLNVSLVVRGPKLNTVFKTQTTKMLSESVKKKQRKHKLTHLVKEKEAPPEGEQEEEIMDWPEGRHFEASPKWDTHTPKSRATKEHGNKEQVDQAARTDMAKVDLDWEHKGELFIAQWAHDTSGHLGRDAMYRPPCDRGLDLTTEAIEQETRLANDVHKLSTKALHLTGFSVPQGGLPLHQGAEPPSQAGKFSPL
ncbi:hypothetical protein QYF61_027647 [Mycteria americana]|uniref:Uncharacterized protein n=1 Tax=Mycteria americana TaxID=33587 RepID=A0AAN7NHR4_MYCAM|nr:hypothetical protein QYF61_027647 [Mycteria americana]